jgi:signal transduction histidine kinase
VRQPVRIATEFGFALPRPRCEIDTVDPVQEIHISDAPEKIAHDIAAINRIGAVPGLLQILCHNTGMGFAAVARVTDGTWTACAVQDDIGFGLKPGGQLDVNTTLCKESRAGRQPVVIDQASLDPVYRDHHTPRIYGIESYVSVPIVLGNGDYFGNLCAIDPRPAKVSNPRTVAMFTSYAELIANQLDQERRLVTAESALVDERAISELREHFMAVLGHDLRNPLAAVAMAADALVKRGSTIDAAAVGKGIKRSAVRMSRLIEDVLDFARARLGSGIGLNLAIVDDLGDAIADVAAELQLSHPSRVILTSIEVSHPVVVDRGRIQQLLSNLLGNALHHGAADRPAMVDVSIEKNWLVLAVTNYGNPIAPEHIEKIFQPYWRSPTGDKGGLGLGLHICEQIVAAHKGTLEVNSSVENGTRFVARVPVAQRGAQP